MKTPFKLLLMMAALATVIWACSSNDDPAQMIDDDVSVNDDVDPSDDGPIQPEELNLDNLTESLNLNISAKDIFLEELSKVETSQEAVYNTAVWLHQQPTVENVTVFGEYLIEVVFNTQLKTNIVLNDSSEENFEGYRGFGKSFAKNVVEDYDKKEITLKSVQAEGKGKKIIENRNVLLFNPYESEFYENEPYPIELFDNSVVPLEVTKLSDGQASLQNLKELEDKGLIIINSHGNPGQIILNRIEDIEQRINRTQANDFLIKETGASISEFTKNELIPTFIARYRYEGDRQVEYLGLSIAVAITPAYIRQSLQLDNAMVFLNFCYSGDQISGDSNNLVQAFLDVGAKSVYSYSDNVFRGHAVSNKACKGIERVFIKNLVQDGELSGNANQRNPPNDLPMTELEFVVTNGQVPSYILIYKIRPNEDGTYSTYRRFYESSGDNSLREFASILFHDGDPEYTYDGCIINTEEGKGGDCGPFYIEPNGETLAGNESLALQLKHQDDEYTIPNDDYDYRVEWSNSGKHGQFADGGNSSTVINSDSITYTCTDTDTNSGTEDVQASIYIKPKGADDDEYELVNTTDAIINIKNDTTKIFELPLVYYYYEYEGSGSCQPETGFESGVWIEIPKDPDATRYSVQWGSLYAGWTDSYFNGPPTPSWTNESQDNYYIYTAESLPPSAGVNPDSFYVWAAGGTGCTPCTTSCERRQTVSGTATVTIRYD